MNGNNLEFTSEQRESYRWRREILIQVECNTDHEQLPVKEFLPSLPNLPRLNSYKGDSPPSYWKHWLKQSYERLRPFNSWICPEKVKEVASNLGYSGNEKRLVRVIDRLEKGCDIGCIGTGFFQQDTQTQRLQKNIEKG